MMLSTGTASFDQRNGAATLSFEARESETLVQVGVEATRLSQSVLEQLRDLERGVPRVA